MVTINKFFIGLSVVATACTFAACDDKELTLGMPENQLITAIELDVDQDLPLLVGTDSTISYHISPANVDVEGLLWKSSNELVATVTNDGTISALSVGRTTITVTPSVGFGNDQTTRSISVNVVSKINKVTKIEFANTETSLYEEDKLQLEPVLYPENHTYSHLLWSSNNEAVATVDKNGVVTGVKPGEADIIAATHDGGNCKGVFHVKVMKSEPATEVAILPYTDKLYFKQKLTLDFTTVPLDATRATIQWSSSDESILSVEGGVVTAEGFGTATITATCAVNGKSSSIELTVDPGYYIWDASTAFEGWSINSALGKFNIKDGVMECTVTEDANARIYIQRCYSTAKNQMNLNFEKYPIIAMEVESTAAKGTFAINLANIGNSVNINKNLTKVDLGNGKTLMYYDGSDLKAMSDENGLVPIRAFMFKITKVPVATFNIYSIRVFESIDQMNAIIKK